jgi:hypothetical protein
MQDILTTAATLTEAEIALFIILGATIMSRRRPLYKVHHRTRNGLNRYC